MQTTPEAPIVEVPQSDSQSIVLQMMDFASHRLWVNHKLIHSGLRAKHTIAITDERDIYACQHLSSYDNVRLSISRVTLHELADEFVALNRTPEPLTLQQYGRDEVLLNLVQALLPSLNQREPGDALFVEHLTLAIATHLVRRYSMPASTLGQHLPVTGLNASQFNRVKDYVRHHFSQSMTLSSIASDCGMSRAAFARAFKKTTGVTPFSWVRAQRIEYAKALLQRTDMTMAAISAQCGFADQSHFSRVFTETVGMKPTQWRAENNSLHAPGAAIFFGLGD